MIFCFWLPFLAISYAHVHDLGLKTPDKTLNICVVVYLFGNKLEFSKSKLL